MIPTDPPSKKQKLDIKEDEDDDILDLTSDNVKVRRKRVSNKEKLSQMGGLLDSYGIPVSALTIKYDLLDVKLSDKHLAKSMIDIFNGEKSAFAKGCDHYFIEKIAKNGRKYNTKVRYDPKAPWASKVASSGGGKTSYSEVEEILFEAACIFIVAHGHLIGIVPEAGILGKENVKILSDFYRILAVESGYAALYPTAVFMRDHTSIRKKLKGYADQWASKKLTTPQAMKIKNYFGGWPLKYKIIQSNEQCLVAAKENKSNDESVKISKGKGGGGKGGKGGTSNMLHEIRSKLVTMTNTLQSNIAKSTSTIDSLQLQSMSDIIPTTVALPPNIISNNNINNNTNTSNASSTSSSPEIQYDSIVVYEVIDKIEDCVKARNISSQKGEQLTDLLLLCYHNPDKHKRTKNLISFINQKSNILQYLKLLEKDLNM